MWRGLHGGKDATLSTGVVIGGPSLSIVIFILPNQSDQLSQNLYSFFPHRADALMELIDALASNTNARSVVEQTS